MIRSFIYQTRAKPGPDLNQLLLNGGILPIGGASLVEGLQSTGLPRLILMKVLQLIVLFQSFHNTIAMANGFLSNHISPDITTSSSS